MVRLGLGQRNRQEEILSPWKEKGERRRVERGRHAEDLCRGRLEKVGSL